jgi:hypothetical protein
MMNSPAYFSGACQIGLFNELMKHLLYFKRRIRVNQQKFCLVELLPLCHQTKFHNYL